MKRHAIVKNGSPTRALSQREVEAYLPDNYRVVYSYFVTAGPRLIAQSEQENAFVIAGEDVDGWTFEHYVQPRLASGNIIATEIDLRHPIMRHVAA